MEYSEVKGIFEEFGYDESVYREFNGLVENLSLSEVKELREAINNIGDYSYLDEDSMDTEANQEFLREFLGEEYVGLGEELYDYLLNYVKDVSGDSVCLSFWESKRRGLVSSTVDVLISFKSGNYLEYDGCIDVLITDLSADELRDYLKYLDELIQKCKEISTDEYGDYYESYEYITKLGLDTNYKGLVWG